MVTPSSPAWQHAYADVNGVRLHYVTAGHGPLLLFLHGFPEFWYAWRHQIAAFSQEYQVVAPDMRGYNLSAKPPSVEAYRIPHLTEDVRALVTHLGHQRFTLIGHDWGGAVAWAFALQHPALLARLIIINMAHPATFVRELRSNAAQQQASQYMLLFRSERAEEVLAADNYARLSRSVLAPGLEQGYLTAADQHAYLEAWSQPGALTGGLNYYRAARIGPITDTETSSTSSYALDPASLVVHVPTLVIWGEQDQALLPGNLQGLEDFVPRLTIKRIADASHLVVHEKTELVNTYIREFLAIQG